MKFIDKLIIFIFATALMVHASAKEFKPKITLNEPDAVSQDISYFDDSSNILALRKDKLYVSFDNGAKWDKVKDTEKDTIIELQFDKFNKNRAFAFTVGSKQYFTNDKGKSWQSFNVLNDKDDKKELDSYPKVSFNAKNPNYMMFDFYTCPENEIFSNNCKRNFYYTKDGFKSNPTKLNIDSTVCKFAKSNELFNQGKDETIYCAKDKTNSFGHVLESYLVMSDDFFKSSKDLNHEYSKSGKIIDIRVEQTFIMAVVQNDKFSAKSKVTLLISKDGKTFDAADLQIEVAYGIMTFLDSSPLSLFVSVSGYTNPLHQVSLSTVYASDSSGLKFHKVIDRVQGDAIKKAQTIDGVWLANVVNEEKSDEDNDGHHSLLDLLIGGGYNKNVVSQISFDDGRNWENLKIVDDDDCPFDKGCSLHLLSPSERDGEGNFVTGPTPGILLGVGSKGKRLNKKISNMNTYISRDGGATWSMTLEEPCLFSFGDQGNVIIAVPYYGKDKTPTKSIHYSLDQGKSWQTIDLEKPFYPLLLTTTIDGTSTNFLLSGLENHLSSSNDFESSEYLYAFDFSDAFDGKTCGDKDFEDVYARVTDDKKPICMYGHREKFKRRKQESKCFVNKLFEDVKIYDEPCECKQIDFECAPGFKSLEDACVPDSKTISKMCKSQKVKEIKLPDKVLIEGNSCKMGKKDTKQFVTEHKLKCSDYNNKGDANNELIHSSVFEFEGQLRQYSYIDQGEDYTGENIIVQTSDNRAYASRDGGIEFVKIPVYEEITAYYTGLIPGQIVLLTDSEDIFVSVDAGNSYVKYKAPSTPSEQARKLISFNKDDVNQFIWYASEGCSDPFSSDCKLVAYITKNGGDSFEKLRENVRVCDFVSPYLTTSDNLIYCEVVDQKSKKVNLVSSQNYFEKEDKLYEDIAGYALIGNFVVVARLNKDDLSLKALVTVDGSTFADADFPHDLHVDAQQAYTILDAQSKAIFMHITTKNQEDHEYGAILKSNSNGTSYVLSLDHVNRNSVGYVDYDRIDGIEGLIIANTVKNFDTDKDKKLKTQISHNDGGEWNYLVPPSVDSKGKSYKCNGKSLEDCSLNLHGFTERADYRDTYSSSSAVGLMMGIGNVGSSLGKMEDGSTFLSNDGGITWREIRKGIHMWEYGDRGSILVIIESGKVTKKLSYSLDEGNSWKDYEFSEKEIQVMDIATVPSDNSRKFLVFGHSPDSEKTNAFSIDFTDIHSRQCQLDLDNPDNDDFEYWSPKHPKAVDNCLFGHEAKYLRRAEGHDDCFIGAAPLADGFKITRNCSCTRKDYECDYNYYRDFDETCKLVKGLSPSDHQKDMCKNDVFQYFEPTGYRRIPLSTCVGGKQFDSFDAKPCPGKQSEFNKYYGREIGGGLLLLIIGVPLIIFFLATWFVYDRGIRRNGGFKQFGQIRLDDDDFDFHPIENNQVDKVVNQIVKGGIFAAATVVATVKTLQKMDKAMINKLTSVIFKGRAGRRNYVLVPNIDEEEEELFGNFHDNYEEELEEGGENFQSNFEDNRDDSIHEDESRNVEADARLFDIDD